MPFQLLAEGSGDMHIARQNQIEFGPREVTDCQGITRLLHELLPAALKGTATVAIVVDADLDPDARWNAVRHQLHQAGYEAPAIPPADGLILTNRRPPVGVWLMPDNSLPGALEDFATHLIPPQDSLWPRAIRVVAEIPEAERRFKAARKAEVHTWLAWQEEPGTPLGQAVTKRYFQTDADVCKRFVDWLSQLKGIN